MIGWSVPWIFNACWQKTRGKKKHGDSLWFLCPSSGPKLVVITIAYYSFGEFLGYIPSYPLFVGNQKPRGLMIFPLEIQLIRCVRGASPSSWLCLPWFGRGGDEWGPRRPWNLRYQGHIFIESYHTLLGAQSSWSFHVPSLICNGVTWHL